MSFLSKIKRKTEAIDIGEEEKNPRNI